MSELWREDFIPINPFSRPGIPLRPVRNIVIHWTANPGATAANHVNYFGKTIARQDPNDSKPDTYASAHMFVDPDEAVLIIPLTEQAYHASSANPYSIGIEMCVEQDGSIHPDTVQRTVQIVTELCRQYGLDPLQDVIRHYDVTGKFCPKPFVVDPEAWEEFKTEVDKEMRGEEQMLDKDLANTAISFISKDYEANKELYEQHMAEGNVVGADACLAQMEYAHDVANRLRDAAGLPKE